MSEEDSSLSEPWAVIARSLTIEDEPGACVALVATVGDGPTYETRAESVLAAVGDLASAVARDATRDEAILWREREQALKTAAARVLELVFGGDWNTGRPGDPLADAVTALRALLKE